MTLCPTCEESSLFSSCLFCSLLWEWSDIFPKWLHCVFLCPIGKHSLLTFCGLFCWVFCLLVFYLMLCVSFVFRFFYNFWVKTTTEGCWTNSLRLGLVSWGNWLIVDVTHKRLKWRLCIRTKCNMLVDVFLQVLGWSGRHPDSHLLHRQVESRENCQRCWAVCGTMWLPVLPGNPCFWDWLCVCLLVSNNNGNL